MGSCILKLANNEYVEWSTVVDAPVTYIMSRDKIKAELGGDDIEDRLSRADERGSSMLAPTMSLEQALGTNRAGPHESHASLAEIRARFGEEKANE